MVINNEVQTILEVQIEDRVLVHRIIPTIDPIEVQRHDQKLHHQAQETTKLNGKKRSATGNQMKDFKLPIR